jgi:hypothetical protein
LLVAARKTHLIEALRDSAAEIDPKQLSAELARYAPASGRTMLARAGIRDEEVFVTPVILEHTPTLLGYYRLLLGHSQKAFFTSPSGLSKFKSLEEKGLLNGEQQKNLGQLCKALNGALAALVKQLSPTVTRTDLEQLPLLTLGAQFYGSNNNAIGKQATTDVFLAIAEIVRPYIKDRTAATITVKNASGRLVRIRLSADPDVGIEEEFDSQTHKKVAIEIKGGSDVSNVHNRAGEAEKSHQKARNEGYRDFWTVIALTGLDASKLRRESPTTTSWFDAAQVLGQQGQDWDAFRRRVAGEVGIPLM